MAKRARTRTITRTVAVPSRAPAPVIKLNVPRAVGAPRASFRRRVRHGARRAVTALGGEKHNLLAAGGAFILGHLQKSGDLAKVPTFLGLGPIGSAAILAWGVSKYFVKSPTAKALASGMVCVAAFNFGNTGRVGEEVMGAYPGRAAVYG
jgi:hypothetical protein